MSSPVDPRRELLETLVAPFRAYALYAAAKLRVPDLIKEGYTSLDMLATETGTHTPSLRRLLRALTYQRAVDTDDFEEYKLTDAGELLCYDHPSHLHDLVILYAEQAYPSFTHILHSLRTGEPGFPLVFGATFLEHYKRNPEAGAIFDRAMAAGKAFFQSLPDVIDVPDGATVVDVGGGDGSLLEALLTALPNIRGVLADERLDSARARLGNSPVGDRCDIVKSDFFNDVPAGHDIYLLSRCLHNWRDEDCVRILATIRKAMDPGSTLLIIERVVGLPDERSLAVDWDLHMLVNTGGVERTLDEYENLLSQTGFEYTRHQALPQDVMVLRAVAI